MLCWKYFWRKDRKISGKKWNLKSGHILVNLAHTCQLVARLFPQGQWSCPDSRDTRTREKFENNTRLDITQLQARYTSGLGIPINPKENTMLLWLEVVARRNFLQTFFPNQTFNLMPAGQVALWEALELIGALSFDSFTWVLLPRTTWEPSWCLNEFALSWELPPDNQVAGVG